ncbi:MAG: transglycosylase SLT domain-containing protein [Deltaproteobacteria bacterium]|nr:transglycosylase SLT domain-containing protein [Deltaproteobacteria bacterium]
MLHLLRKAIFIALTGAFLLTFAAIPSNADDALSRAAAEFREKEYGKAFSLAQQSAETPQRTFLLGVAALRLGKSDEAVRLLADAERTLPLLGDYASLYQAEALLKVKRYTEAAAKAASLPKLHPASQLVRRSEKLSADILFEAGDYRGALRLCQAFVEKYPTGGDSVDALFLAARSREETGDKGGAAQIYRGIWLNNPAAPQAKMARERLRELEAAGIKVASYTPEELLRRASALYAQNDFGQTLQTLQSIPLDGQSAALVARVELRSGMARFRQRNYKQAEMNLSKAALCDVAGIRSEARFWLARTLERQELHERALAIYLELAEAGKRQELGDDALMQAAGLRRGLGSYAEAARIFEQLPKSCPDSRFIPRAAWDAAWCRYLAGDHIAAADAFKALLKDETVREKALYWLARALENAGAAEAANWYRILLDEYPAGFYAAWHREQKGIGDAREGLGRRDAMGELPLAAGFEKPRLLASLGMLEEARGEMAALRKRLGEKGALFPAMARVYLEIADYGSAIYLFMQNRPLKWDRQNLPLWTAGYPLAYTGLIREHASANAISESLIYALIRAESGFSPAIRSHAGAIGLMQLMPDTARATTREKGEFNPLRLTVPDFNIKLGTRHLRELLDGYDGDAVYAVAAYNAGAKAVERWRKNFKGLKKDEFIESIPYQETRDYVKKVYASAAVYRQLYGLR